ncbi:hypothetical protein M4I21_01645 [Cellulophaga sp. 20_2_10]|uniref:hypothetical protein n=1 Tax=Cellulophaga sp. 20_2_10 TaxID=2942476 RepID=UPI00201A37F6|nr:hypothetical protein [Cellulophaga sp. 20_2_10]MCL5244491.1 hypothetical protein [Cellulophaga sp. 20_2_10]
MKNFRLLLLLLIFSYAAKSTAQELKEFATEEKKTTIKNSTNFIPDGYEIVTENNKDNICIADFNNDTILDFVVLLASGENNKAYANSKDIRLAIFEGQNDGTFKLKNQTGNLTYAFIYYSIADRLSVDAKNTIHLKHQSMRHDYILKIKYQNTTKDYVLIGAEYANYGSGISSREHSSTNFITGERIFKGPKNKITKVATKLKPIAIISDDTVYDLISD